MTRARPLAHLARTVILLAGVALAGVAATEIAVTGPRDTTHDATASVLGVLRPLASLTAVGLGVLVATALLHHLWATLAARAAAGVHLPGRELFAATFSAASANRVTPAGVGGAALLARVFVRRGGLAPSRATAAVSALALVGALGDATVFALLVAAGAVLGVTRMTAEAPHLVTRFAAAVPLPLVAAAGAAGAAGGVALLILRRRRAATAPRVTRAARGYRDQLVGLASAPWRLLGLAAASSGTTLTLATGFATLACLPPSGLPVADFGPLMIGYMVAAAAGSALPTPGGIGTADAALVGVLAVDHVPAAHAVATVLAFRLATFWAPAAVGLVTTRTLRRRGAL